MKRLPLVLILVCCCCALRADQQHSKRPEKNILVLVSYHLTHDWTRQLTAALEEHTGDLPVRLHFNFVEFDAIRIHDADGNEKKLQTCLEWVASGNYDMIVVLDDPVINLLLAHYAELPAGLPIVVAGYEYPPPDLKEKYPNVTGVIQHFNTEGLFRLALALYPDTREFLILSDSSPMSLEFERRLKAENLNIDGVRFSFVNNADRSLKAIFNQIENLPEESLVLLSPWRGLYGNDYQTLEAFAVDLSRFCKRPFLVSGNTMIGYGALGGYVTDPIEHGRETAAVIREVIEKGGAESIPLVQGKVLPEFDYQVMRDNRLDFGKLPPDAILRNRPPSYWEKHRHQAIGVGTMVLLVLSGAAAYGVAVRRTLQRSRKLYEVLPARIGVLNREEKILYMNGVDAHTANSDRAKRLCDIMDIDYPKISAAVREVFLTGQKRTLDYEIRSVKRVMTLAPISRRLFGQEAVVWFSHDNAELQDARKQAEAYAAQLKHSVRMWDIVTNSLPIHIFAKDADDDFKYIFTNVSQQQFFGLSADELQGKTDFDIFPAELAGQLRREDEENMRDLEHGFDNIIRLERRDGRIASLQITRYPFVGEDGSRWLLGAAFDVTELEEAKHRAEENADWFKLTLDSIGDGVLTTDVDGRVMMLNPVAERMLGVTLAEAAGRPHEEIFHIVGSPDGSSSPIARTLRTGATVEQAGHTDLLSRNGRRYHISDSAAPIRSHGGELSGAILVFRDVTEEYVKRNQLRDALTSLEYASELTCSASFRMNLRTREIAGSKLLPELWPLRGDKAIPREEFVLPEDVENYIRVSNRILNRECEISTWDYRSDFFGELRYFRMRASIDWSVPEEPYLLGVIQDITEITHSIGRLKETMELWELVINSIPIMFFAKDADYDFRYVLCNQAYADFLCRSREEILGRTDAELFCRPEDAAWFHRKDLEIMAKPEGEEFEESCTGPQGNVLQCKTMKKPFLGLDGRRLLLGAFSDISELKHLIASERFNSEVLAYTVGEPDFGRVLEYIADRLKRQMAGDRVVLARCNGEGRLRLEREWLSAGSPSIRGAGLERLYRAWDEYCRLMRDGRILRFADLAENELAEPGAACGACSQIVAPIFEESRLWGALFVCYAGRRRTFSDADEWILRSCSNVIALALAREKQAQKIKRSEREMQLILDNIDIPISLHAADGKLLHVNTAVCRMTGLETEALLASPESEVFYLGTTPPADSPLKQIIAGKKSASADLCVDCRQYIIHADAVIDDHGKLINIVKSATEVTELNALIKNQSVINFCLETLLRESDMQKAIFLALRAVCHHIGASRSYIFQFDTDRKTISCFIEYAEPGRATVFGKVKDQPYDTRPDWEGRFAGQESIAIESIVDQAGQEGLGESWVEMATRYSMCSLYANRIMLDSKFWGYIGLVYEDHPHAINAREVDFIRSVAHFIEAMLDRWQAQTQLLEALQKAQAADKAKSFFIASVSHEIRTPLNSVIGFSELLREGQVSPQEQKEYVDNIAYSGNALLQLINDVLDLSKLEAGQVVLVPTPTDFGGLGREVMKVFSFRAAERNVALQVEMPQLPELELDKQRIRQILFNLIGNAVKFTERGSIVLRAEFVPADGERGILRFSVADTGIGIAEKDRKRLMEPFVQLSNLRGTNAANNGTGLGLAISKRLAEAMGGRLWLESELGKGSTFGVTLHGVKFHRTRHPEAVTPARPEEEDAGEPVSILIVDDVEMNLQVMKAMCAKAGLADVVAVASGPAALAELEKRRFDLVMTDLWMPGMNGAELAQKIHADRRFAALPIISVTADVEAQNNFAQDHFACVLLKPVTLAKVQQVVEAVRKKTAKLIRRA